MSTLPGTVEAHAATLQTNDFVSTDAEGDVLVYLRWGAANPSRLMAEFPLVQYARWSLYSEEAKRQCCLINYLDGPERWCVTGTCSTQNIFRSPAVSFYHT